MVAGNKVNAKETQFDVLRKVLVCFVFLERRVALQRGSFYYAFNPHSNMKHSLETLLVEV